MKYYNTGWLLRQIRGDGSKAGQSTVARFMVPRKTK